VEGLEPFPSLSAPIRAKEPVSHDPVPAVPEDLEEAVEVIVRILMGVICIEGVIEAREGKAELGRRAVLAVPSGYPPLPLGFRMMRDQDAEEQPISFLFQHWTASRLFLSAATKELDGFRKPEERELQLPVTINGA